MLDVTIPDDPASTGTLSTDGAGVREMLFPTPAIGFIHFTLLYVNSWWEADSSYVGSSCALPHPWGVPHKLVHRDRAAFPQHIPYSPIYPVFCGDLWRELHGLGPCPQPPRPLLYLFCHNYIYAFVLLLPEWPQLSFGPTWHILLFSGQIWKCLAPWWYVRAKPSVMSTGRWGCLPNMR